MHSTAGTALWLRLITKHVPNRQTSHAADKGFIFCLTTNKHCHPKLEAKVYMVNGIKTSQGKGVEVDMDIQPEWILEGKPVANGQVMMQSHDETHTSGIWECSAGAFEFTFGWNEICQILEGEATVEEDDGTTHTLRAGDFAHFPLGLKTKWHIPERVRSLFFIVTPEPWNL